VIGAFLLAVSELFEPRFRRVLLRAIGVSLLAFVLLWAGLGWLLLETTLFQSWWLEDAVDLLGGLAAFVLSLFLFPAAIMLVTGLLLDGIVEAVEQRHYPELGPARDISFAESLWAAVRLGGIAAALNLLLLPLYLVLPGINLVLFWSLNGYLLGREYFELIALRRLDPRTARALRRARGGAVFLAGTAIAFLLTIPFLNLAAPVIGAAFMLHLFERWRRAGIH
jgi:CysZ protein